MSDLASGDTIIVVGTKASDGSLTATTIREGATGFGAFGGGPRREGRQQLATCFVSPEIRAQRSAECRIHGLVRACRPEISGETDSTRGWRGRRVGGPA